MRLVCCLLCGVLCEKVTAPPLSPVEPLYLSTEHPEAVNVSLGRQLFVDNFLVDGANSSGLATVLHQAEWNSTPLLAATLPWVGRHLCSRACVR